MTDGAVEPETQVFVLRCWRETDAVLQPWRIQVEHVPSGRRIPLADLGLLRSLVEEYLGLKDVPRLGP